MEVILLEKIRKLGDLGDVARVKPGYARNFLIPQGKAAVATADNIAAFEARRAELEQTQEEALSATAARAEQLNATTVTVTRKAGAEGKLYGSVNTADIAAAVAATGVELQKREVRLPDGPLRMVGEYKVEAHLHADVDATVTVVVAAEEG